MGYKLQFQKHKIFFSSCSLSVNFSLYNLRHLMSSSFSDEKEQKILDLDINFQNSLMIIYQNTKI